MGRTIAADSEIVQAALRYAERNWLIFPCDPATKRPVTEHGLLDATRDQETIRTWWTRWPGAMIGCRTGGESGMWVVDLDVDGDRDGISAFATLAKGKDAVPDTITTRTPRGGKHLFFKWIDGAKNSAGKLAPGVDTRGDGGYVILPPSTRADGRVYETVCDCSDGPAEAPRWLTDLVIAAPEVTPRATPPTGKRTNGSGYGDAALDAECANVSNAAPGSRNHTLNRAAFALGQLVAAGELGEGEVRRRLTDAANALAKDDGAAAIGKTIDSGLAAGMQYPRQRQEQRAPHAKDEEPAPPLRFLDLRAWHGEPIPERAWTVPGRIPAGAVTLLSGDGGVGKTIIGLHLGVAIVLGRDWASTLPEPGPALIVACEDDDKELHRRLAKIVEHYGASFAELASDLHVVSLAGEDALLATPDRTGLMVPTKLFTRVHEAACDLKPKLIMLDNSADIFGGNENDRAQVRQFVGLLRGGLAMASGAGVLLTSHPSLTGISSGTGLSGSTAWNASVRSRLFLKKATTEKGDEPDPDLRVLEVMKANYGPVGETITMRWTDGLFLPVASMNSLDRLAREQKVDQLFLTLLDRWIGQGRNVSDKRTANTYAPSRFADEPETKAEHVSKRELAEAMERLFRAGRIRNASYGLPSKGWTRLERK